MAKLYFQDKNAEICEPKESILDMMRFEGYDELEVYEAKKDIGSDFFFCRDVWEVGEKGECGKQCKSYQPRNGKNGICKHNAPVYEHGEKITLTLKQ